MSYQIVGQAHRLPRADVNCEARELAGEATALQLLFLVELKSVRPVSPILNKACANRILLDVKPLLMQRLIGA